MHLLSARHCATLCASKEEIFPDLKELWLKRLITGCYKIEEMDFGTKWAEALHWGHGWRTAQLCVVPSPSSTAGHWICAVHDLCNGIQGPCCCWGSGVGQGWGHKQLTSIFFKILFPYLKHDNPTPFLTESPWGLNKITRTSEDYRVWHTGAAE